MILILGASGYLGRAFVSECELQGIEFHVVPRDFYSTAPEFVGTLRRHMPSLVINCAAFIPTPSVDLCKNFPAQTYHVNVALPTMLSLACHQADIPLTHLSTGCFYDEKREYVESESPTRDPEGYCGAYLLSKKSAEDAVAMVPKHYILRLRLPFDEFDHPRNYLTKLASFTNVFDHVNSLTHRGDFVKAALDLWRIKAPYGTYHVVNPGHISAMETIARMTAAGIPVANHECVDSETTGCTLSTKKLLDAGVKIRTVHEALDAALKNWRK